MILRFLYHTRIGRCFLKVLTEPSLSEACGSFLDSRWSIPLIRPFVRRNGISMEEYQEETYTCFNDFFCRKIRPEMRPVDPDPRAFTAPCDGLLSAYPIENGLVIPVKESRYSVADLLRDEDLAAEYDGGTCLVFRLCVTHYHRYCYPDSGYKTCNVFLPGILHTVQPIALRTVPVFLENSREYTILHTDHFGSLIQMEVGAMLVGKIDNYREEGRIARGEEKGRFLYGGSTVIILVKKDALRISKKVFEQTKKGIEIPVRMGQRIGKGPDFRTAEHL